RHDSDPRHEPRRRVAQHREAALLRKPQEFPEIEIDEEEDVDRDLDAEAPEKSAREDRIAQQRATHDEETVCEGKRRRLAHEARAAIGTVRHEAQEAAVDAESGNADQERRVQHELAIAPEVLDGEQVHENDRTDENQPLIQYARHRDDGSSTSDADGATPSRVRSATTPLLPRAPARPPRRFRRERLHRLATAPSWPDSTAQFAG